MAVPENKEALLAAIKKTYQQLSLEIQTITPANAELKTLEGHAKDTKMSILNLLSYLTGWAELVLKWHRKMQSGESVDFPESGYKWNELGKLAGKFYTDYEQDDLKSIVQKLDQAVQDILTLIDSKSNEELYEREWYGKWTMGRMIQFNTSSPYTNARGRIRKWKKENL